MTFDFEQEFAYQQRQWRFQRLGWSLMGVFLLMGLFGLLGSGPLSQAEVHNDQTQLNYQRLVRLESPAVLELETQSQAPELRLEISRDFLDGFALEQIVPRPVHSETGPDSYTYVFQASSAGRVKLALHLMPQKIGAIAAELRLHQPLVEEGFWANPQSGGIAPLRISTTRIRFSQWVLP